MKKLFVLSIICMVLLVGTISAFEWDNKITYSEEDLKIELRNSFLLIPTTLIGTAELKSHKSVDQVLEFGFGKKEVVMYYDLDWFEFYENALGEVYFTDQRTGEEIQKDYSFVYWTNETYEKDIYGRKCSKSENGTNVCENVLTGKEDLIRGVWKPYNSNDIQKGKIRIGLKTYVGENDYIDGVWTIAGKKVEKHAGWLASLNSGIIRYYKLNESVGNGTASDSIGEQDCTVNNAVQSNSGGKIGGSVTFDSTQFDEYLDCTNDQSDFNDYSISAWVYLDSGVSTSNDFPGIVSMRTGVENDFTEGVTFHFARDAPNWFLSGEGSTFGSLPRVSATTIGSGMSFNTFHLVTLTVDRDGEANGVRLYVDGVNLLNATAINNPTHRDNIIIGARVLSGSTAGGTRG